MSDTLAKHGNVEAVRYDKDGVPGAGAHHLHEINPITGFKHLSSDEYLQSMGYDPTPAAYTRNAVPATYENTHPPLVGGQVEPPAGTTTGETPPAGPELAALQQQIEQLIQQFQDQNQEIGQLRDQLRDLTDQLRQLAGQMDQLTQQLVQQNANYLQQNANILQILQQLIANQQPPVPLPPAPAPAPTPAPVPVPAPAPAPVPATQPPPGPFGGQPFPLGGNQPPATPQPPVQPPAAGIPLAPGGPTNPNQQPGPTTPEQQAFNDAEVALGEARNDLMEITIRRKARTRLTERFTRSGRADRQDYELALNAYEDALDNYMAARRALLESQNQNMTHEQLARQLTRDGFAERKNLANLEVDMNNQQLEQLGWVGKLLRRYANLSTKKKFILGLTAGGLTALAAGPLGLGVAGALAIGIPARFSLGWFNKRASLRNVSDHSRDMLLRRITREERRTLWAIPGLGLNTDAQLEMYRGDLVENVRDYHDGERQWGQRRQAIGAVIMGASVAVGFLGGFGELPIPDVRGHIPWFDHGGGSVTSGNQPPGPWGGPSEGSGGGAGFSGGAGAGGGEILHNLPGNFNPNTFYGNTHDELVRGMFKVFHENGISVHGDSEANIHAIAQDIASNHWQVAEGINADGTQHMVDFADKVANVSPPWSGAHGIDNWQQVMDVAERHGVTFTQGG